MPPGNVSETSRPAVPSAALMHFAFLLSGIGTMLLGPILPELAREWHLHDSQSGLLFMAKFIGASLGGFTVSKHLHRSLMLGFALGAVGFAAFAVAPGIKVAATGLLVSGYGLGLMITAANILAGRRYTSHRGSALALLNFSWSLGALLCPLLAAWLVPAYPLHTLLMIFAMSFVAGGLLLAVQMRRALEEFSPQSPTAAVTPGLPLLPFLYFALLLLLYGGLETSLSGWLTTFAQRYGGGGPRLGEYALMLLLIGLTGGRALSSLLLLKVRELPLQRVSLALAALFTGALALAHSASAMAVFAVLLGLSLAPFFPTMFSLLIAEKPTARQAGSILAVSGLGAAALPWMMGLLSTRTGSLQVALVIPFATAVLLLATSFLPFRGRAVVPSR